MFSFLNLDNVEERLYEQIFELKDFLDFKFIIKHTCHKNVTKSTTIELLRGFVEAKLQRKLKISFACIM